ncbi:MAG: dTDP-4-dehydrorhamnose reductase [Bacteroidales bacterium]|nr:dTDP-4-dehydrorhamnose reductase [Bacteroidales bacterium]
MKIIVTGSKGQLGNEVAHLSKNYPDFQFVYIDIDELDLTDAIAVEQFMTKEQPNVVLNCAAYTAVDKAETDLEKASAVNIGAVENLSLMSAKFGYFLISISTDYVFDGRQFQPIIEDQPMTPESAYGLTKAGGEAQMRNLCPHGAIIRTAWLYSIYGNNFVKTMRKYGAVKEEMKVVCDQIGTPTCTSTLAGFILSYLPQLMEKEGVETYHLTDSGVASWYDFALTIMQLSDLKCHIMPIPSIEYPAAAPRPFYSVLSKQKIRDQFGFIPPHWTEPLKKCIETLKKIDNN